ncbi:MULTISPECIES: hypothetical protein [unclassified Roseobacter]|nr:MULTISPECIES: hypothetical protein [unclassified Roseobacter]MDW3181981.1 hypothetical protein [Roseobacter sp.]
MREIILAFVAMAVIAVGANFALNEAGFSAAEQGTGQAVRLGD